MKETYMNKFNIYYANLTNRLEPLYHPQLMGTGGHDINHIRRMIEMGSEFSEFLDFDSSEYKVAVWLHNIDRSSLVTGEKDTKTVLNELLESSHFDDTARERIVSAVLEHSKKDDEPTDTTLLQALRLADKWDRIGAIGVVEIIAYRGGSLLAYDPSEPFGYDLTAEGRIKTLYQGFFRVLEWYAYFPLIRKLSDKHPERMQILLDFIRAFGSEIAKCYGVENKVEADIEKALGAYYQNFI